MKNKDLKKRILEISYNYKLSHIGSCLTAVDIIDDIYKKKKPEDIFVLSSGHAGLALYVVLEKYLLIDAEELFFKHGVHPNRDLPNNIYCSSGSLGQGLPIALGMALADKSRNVYCLISDGECSEGSIWEALRIQKELYIENLFVYVNMNGWGAYKEINEIWLENQLKYMSWARSIWTSDAIWPFKFLKGQDAHYYTMNVLDYREAMKILL